jgi:hypothetical protein
MRRDIHRNDHYRVDFDDETRLIRMTRSAVPQSVAMLDAITSEMVQVLGPLRPARVLIDMRLAPGNNTPEFEQAAVVATRRLLNGFSAVAVLIQTAIGKLHFQRLNRGSQWQLQVFSDEAEALRFLVELPLSGGR